MCGIAGILSPGGRVQPRDVHAMTDALRHRGPDDEGYLFVDFDGGRVEERRGADTVEAKADGLSWVAAPSEAGFGLGLGHRRLSIIDVSPGGHQPMRSADGQLWLIYNGEIYNYVELRRELEGLGHRFASGSDSEVILQAYAEWGLGCLSKFNGMWAFALADLRTRRLVCARDRLGVKPFYYYLRDGTFAFASELRALLGLPFVQVAPNPRTIWDFLVLGAVDHTRETFFSDVVALEAGHYLDVSFDGAVRNRRFWDLEAVPGSTETNPPALAEASERVRELFINAVRLRLRSDVSVGFCLSGGLDSSSVVGVADRLLDEGDRPQVGPRLNVFHAAYDDPSVDERAYVRAVLDQTRVAPHFVFPSGRELVDDYARLVWQQEQPFGGPSVYAQYRVFGLARTAGVKVILDGQAGDELFAGYYRYIGAQLTRFVTARQLHQTRALLNVNGTGPVRHAGLHEALRMLPVGLARQALLRTSTEPGLIAHEFLTAFADRADHALDDERQCQTLGQMLARDLTRASLPRLLRFEDRNSMAFSLESRVPFADDVPLIEYVVGLPDSAKIWDGWSKYALRQAMHGLVPDVVRWRRRKLGFAVPEQQWAAELRDGPLWDVLAQASGQYIDRRELERHLQATTGKPLGTSIMWRLLELTLWERALADGAFRPRPAREVALAG